VVGLHLDVGAGRRLRRRLSGLVGHFLYTWFTFLLGRKKRLADQFVEKEKCTIPSFLVFTAWCRIFFKQCLIPFISELSLRFQPVNPLVLENPTT
jgi:hypothetical protein